ncbi:MAG: DUF6644 family protein [Caulobacteraceae bacterium]
MLQQFAAWLSQTPVSQFIQNVLWIIPLVQTIHILAIAAVLSSVAMIDLRIFGFAGRSTTMAETAGRYVPWIWWGLLVLALTGVTLITGEPVRSLTNPAFQIKMALLAAAIVVTLVFQKTVHDRAGAWDAAPRLSGAVRAAALGTLLLWFAIAVFGRWIAYMILNYAA